MTIVATFEKVHIREWLRESDGIVMVAAEMTEVLDHELNGEDGEVARRDEVSCSGVAWLLRGTQMGLQWRISGSVTMRRRRGTAKTVA
ncbi:hypothetical protein DEO72_LG11g1311 [Vigna unguiculata]|uniref:Uncharacterized protein n=1 Tax=Vigna unguiculata TaxID=3917 RepID=A0A4D6NMT2_VIGUN|nr:hypothetical protein DEO72_LG2g1944 [Vigna unguiculata]QCE14312.1 hypothetical protein DEO72_LG11g1311 [Vigna unguiculata]